jgi:septal ring factor EnvC (AmiA/AmiB activator)
MIRAATLSVALAIFASAALGQSAQGAAEELEAAAVALEDARQASDRITALTRTIRAYESGLAAMRVELRRAALRETEIRTELDREADRLSRILGVLSSMETAPEALVLLHPAGPVETVRAGLLISGVTPALQAEVADLRARLTELRDLRSLQDSAVDTLRAGLDGIETARGELARAMSERRDLPPPVTTDVATMQALINSAETLQAFASALGIEAPDGGAFAEARGALPRPVSGVQITGFNEADAAGVRRPGLLLATRPGALVTASWPVTIRYRGPLLDHGQVTIVEPEAGYLIVLAGLGTTFGEIGDVVPAGGPLGLMGGAMPTAQEILIESGERGGQVRSETLYIELRQGQTPQDPAEWFDLG